MKVTTRIIVTNQATSSFYIICLLCKSRIHFSQSAWPLFSTNKPSSTENFSYSQILFFLLSFFHNSLFLNYVFEAVFIWSSSWSLFETPVSERGIRTDVSVDIFANAIGAPATVCRAKLSNAGVSDSRACPGRFFAPHFRALLRQRLLSTSSSRWTKALTLSSSFTPLTVVRKIISGQNFSTCFCLGTMQGTPRRWFCNFPFILVARYCLRLQMQKMRPL